MIQFNPDRTPRIEIETAPARGPMRLIAVALAVLALVAAVWFLSWAQGLLIPLAFAVFLTICLQPAVLLLVRVHLPRALAAALVMATLSLLIVGGIDRTRADVVSVLDELPAASAFLRREVNATLSDPGSLAHRVQMLMDLQRNGAFAPPARRVAAAAPAPPIQTSVTEGTRVLVSLTSEVAAVLFLVYLMLASGGSIRRHVARACGFTPQLSHAIQEVFGLIERQMRQYLGLLLITNAILGVSLWAAFSLLGVARAAMWGGAAALLHFVPYVGPAVIAIGSGLLASVQFDSLARGVLVGATTVALSATIGVALTTWLAGRTARMNTIAIFVSLLFWTWLWGLPGLVLGTPITMGLKVVCNKWQRLRWLDALLEGHPRRPLVQRVVLQPISPVPGAAAHK